MRRGGWAQFRLWPIADDRGDMQFRKGQSGNPAGKPKGTRNATTRAYTLDLEQKTPATPGQAHKRPFHIPFAIGLLDRDGNDLPITLDGETTRGPTTRVPRRDRRR